MADSHTAQRSQPHPPRRVRGLTPEDGVRRFPGQQPGEQLLVYQRRHWYLLWQWLRRPLAGALLVALLAAFLGGRLPPGDWGLWFALRIPMLPFLLWALWRALNWENDRYIVTDRRAIHIDRLYFFREERHEARLDRIQNVTVEIPGPLAHALSFGHLSLETAGTEGKITFPGIPRPHEVQAVLLELVQAAHARRQEMAETVEAIQELSQVMDVPQRYRQLAEPREAPVERRSRWDELLGREPYFGPEQVVWRKHWWVLVRGAFVPAGFLAVVGAAWYGSLDWVPPGLGRQTDVAFAFLMAVLGGWLLWALADWKNDYYVATRDRVIDIERIPLIYENRRESSLGAIQDVSYVKPGFMAQRLNFGNVRLQTAAEGGLFTFDQVGDPRRVQAELVRILENYRRRTREEEELARESDALRWLARYHQAAGEPRQGRLFE